MALKALVSYSKLRLKVESDATESVTSFVFGKALVDYVSLQNVTQFSNLVAANILLDPYTLITTLF